MWGVGCGVWGVGCRVYGVGFECRMKGVECRVLGVKSGCRVESGGGETEEAGGVVGVGCRERGLEGPLSSEYGTCKAVKARFWRSLSSKGP